MKDPDYFIVGLQKCGTYWITALLDAHPEIRCLPTHEMHNVAKGKTGADEGRIFDMLASVDDDGGVALKNSFTNHHGGFFKNIVPLIGKVSKKELYRAVRTRYNEWFRFHNPENKPIVGDKTTEYIFHLDMIDEFYPEAKKLCILRDPKDRVVSWHYHQIRKGRIEPQKISDDFIEDYIRNRISKEYQSMLAYPGFIHCFTYEYLSSNPKQAITGILSYLGAKIIDSIIVNMIRKGSIENLRGKDVFNKKGKGKKKGEAVSGSHYRKGIVGDWMNHITASQVAFIDKAIGTLQNDVFLKYGIIKS